MLKIFWFRKDLRIEDNTALSAFLNSSRADDELMFIYIKNRNSFGYFGEMRVVFLYECLRSLSKALKGKGHSLAIHEGDSKSVFAGLIRKHGAVELYFNKQVEPYCIKRDAETEELVARSHGKVSAFDDATLLPPGSVRNGEGGQYKVFTPFSRQAKSILTPADYGNRRVKFPAVQEGMRGAEPAVPHGLRRSELFRGGREEGLKLLKDFFDNGMACYKSNRDFPFMKGTSMLSPHLHFGTVSIREAYRAALKKLSGAASEDAQKEVQTWINELLWREFYYHLTFANPHVISNSFREEYDNVQWEWNESHFNLWCNGMTGYPIVDAGMRQLRQEGWMHNRVRMITAMFLTKDLMIDWRHGERFFASHLIDLDFSSNNGGWQWSASTGADAQPYFRIFNPYLQSRKFDPDGNYIRKFVTELKDVPSAYIHEPGAMNREQQETYKAVIGVDYPSPVVDHFAAKERVIKRFKQATGKPD